MPKRYIDKKFRLKEWNYSSPGSYFVTISTSNKAKYLGSLKGNSVFLNRVGETAYKYWQEIPMHYPFVELGEFVIMPDHVHGIIVIKGQESFKESGDREFSVPTQKVPLQKAKFHHPIQLSGKNTFGPQSRNLGAIIRGYKASVKKFATLNNLHLTWQSRFRDKILWGSEAYDNVSEYIRDHPQPHQLNNHDG